MKVHFDNAKGEIKFRRNPFSPGQWVSGEGGDIYEKKGKTAKANAQSENSS